MPEFGKLILGDPIDSGGEMGEKTEYRIDFDGLILNVAELKARELAHFGLEVEIDGVKRKFIVEEGLLTDPEYSAFLKETYRNRDLMRTYQPVPDAIGSIWRLQNEGYQIVVITAREGEALNIARDWMRRVGLELEILGVGLR